MKHETNIININKKQDTSHPTHHYTLLAMLEALQGTAWFLIRRDIVADQFTPLARFCLPGIQHVTCETLGIEETKPTLISFHSEHRT